MSAAPSAGAEQAALAAGVSKVALVDCPPSSEGGGSTCSSLCPPHDTESSATDSAHNSMELPRAQQANTASECGSECQLPEACAASRSALDYYPPHDGFGKGCPAPPCFTERVETAKAVHTRLDLHDGELECTLRLLCKVFDVETATVSLLTGERIYLVGACGALPVCVCPDRWGFCGWSFLNPNHELNVVEDMTNDARFAENFFVVNDSFKIQFYVMAPLISSNGHRIGTLCIMGQEPRKFDATKGAILANLSELLVRQIERRWAEQEQRKQSGSRLLRSADAYRAACGFVDARDQTSWRLLHLNPAAAELLGVEWTASYDELAKLDEGRHARPFEGMRLRKLLDIDMSSAAWEAAQAELVLKGVKGRVGSPAEGRVFDVTFRLAASEALDEHAPFSIGVPSWLRESDDPEFGANYFFMFLAPASPGTQATQLTRESGLRLAPRLLGRSPIPNLVLGPLLGRGGFGKVFRGVHAGREVAVKIIERLEAVRVDLDGTPIEVSMTQDMHHVGVLRSFAWGIEQPDAAYARYSASAAVPKCWIAQELADKGTLADAVVKGWFRTSRKPTEGGTHLRTVALTAYETASALAYIHAQGVLHLDLSGGNVLLTSSPANPHGFSARVTDFGLARTVDITARTAPGRYGTITHMAPETISDGLLGPPCDVYAWAVQLWEMLTGSRAWAGLTHEAVLLAVGQGSPQLAEPPGLAAMAPVLADLLRRGLSRDPAQRPSWSDVLPALEAYLQSTRDAPAAQLELPLRSDAPPGP